MNSSDYITNYIPGKIPSDRINYVFCSDCACDWYWNLPRTKICTECGGQLKVELNVPIDSLSNLSADSTSSIMEGNKK